MPLSFLSVCSGIEAASVAFSPLGWRAVGFSEIEPFPCSVLAHHYPNVKNYGDLTRQESWQLPAFDVLCGGTPCQGFSVAGKRGGLADARSQLVWHFLEIARRERPRWLLWENVPGVLSSEGGADFGAVLGRLGECGYGFAYRILDAQYFGVAQRRRRVFVVGYLGDWRPAAAVLFERESMSGNPAPSREAGKGTAGTISARTKGGGGLGTDLDCDGGLIVGALQASYGTGSEQHPERVGRDGQLVVHALRAEGHDASEDGTGRGVPLISAALKSRDYKGPSIDGDGDGKPGEGYPAIRAGHAVRRLTPRECERLQGFPDDYTLVPHRGKPAADGPRYKALGNSWAVPCARWIGERIQLIDNLKGNQ